MKKLFRSAVFGLASLALAILPATAVAQVPQDVTFTGRLVDEFGPVMGPETLDIRIYDAPTGGNVVYSEQHVQIPLDATGGFSVQLGLGTNPVGTFDADLFADVNRWLEVEVNGQILGPRQVIGSVPWALVAQQANEIVPDPGAPRFEDCGDGTVADHQTGLQWEKKTGTSGSPVLCDIVSCTDPHDLNNRYPWSLAGTDPDGAAFTDFLARLNGDPSVVAADSGEAIGDPGLDPTVCLGHHCDWRLPAIGELRTILIGSNAAPGQATTCSATPCIDADFAAVGGPTAVAVYWSASPGAGTPSAAWTALFNNGAVVLGGKVADNAVRAVRTGSCD